MKGASMLILSDILGKLRSQFEGSRKAGERGIWFVYTIVAIIIPFTSSKTSNILRCLNTLFDFTDIAMKRFYTFMASPKIPWKRLWLSLWKIIPEPMTDGRLLLALDDYINPKTGRKIFACDKIFDHAAKLNQTKYPWAQNVVTVGLLKLIKGRWACLPLNWRFYHMEKSVERINRTAVSAKIQFETKLKQAVDMIGEIALVFTQTPIVAITDSWFGNNSLWKPLHDKLGSRFHMISRLRSNSNIFEPPPESRGAKRRGRPAKYGEKSGTAKSLAADFKDLAIGCKLNLYGRIRTVLVYERLMMLKTIKCAVKVVWIYRKNQWVALFSTDTTLSAAQIVEYYGARWKIEAAFKELKRDIGSAETQTRNPDAVTNHLNFCMMATSVAWIYADRMAKTPSRRHAVEGRNHFAFSDVRKSVAQAAADSNFGLLFPVPRKSRLKSLIDVLMRMAA